MESSVRYKEYWIDIYETKDDYRYRIKDIRGKLILESASGFPFLSEAEMQAKLYINRISPNKEGWMIS